MKEVDCSKALSLINRLENKDIKEYFRKIIWRYEREKNNKEATKFILEVYLEGAVSLSDKDKIIGNFIIDSL